MYWLEEPHISKKPTWIFLSSSATSNFINLNFKVIYTRFFIWVFEADWQLVCSRLKKKLNNFESLWIFKNHIPVFTNRSTIIPNGYYTFENYHLLNSLLEIPDPLAVDHPLGNGDMEVWCQQQSCWCCW